MLLWGSLEGTVNYEGGDAEMFSYNPATNEIHLTRGDTLTLEFEFEGDVPVGQDQLYFTVKKNPNNTSCVIEKPAEMINEDTAQISLAAEDTIGWPFGKYWWDLRIFYADGEIVTPLSPAPFFVEEVVGNDR